MANRTEFLLVSELYEALQSEQIVFLSTIDQQSGGPFINALSWVHAIDEKTIRLAADSRAKLVENIRMHPLVSLAVFVGSSAYTISGRAKIVFEQIENVSLKTTLIEIDISEVRDVMFYGSKIVAAPAYQKTYDLKAAQKLDGEVMAALKNN